MQHIDYHRISKAFRHKADWTDAEPISFVDEGADLYNLSFTSANSGHLLGWSNYRCEAHQLEFAGEAVDGEIADNLIEENISFRYPLVRDASLGQRSGQTRDRHDRVIILLHGLNERSFSKYLPWAYQLWAGTGTPVLLFPLTFHVNRVLPAWAKTQREVYERRSQLAGNEGAYRFNAVISDRLAARPERFFWGAVQSYLDLVDLARTIRSGRHPHFTPDARIDLFGFSAGGYLSLLLMLEDPEDLFKDSRGIVFASGVPSRDLNLLSPFILDLAAEIAMMRLYVKNLETLSSARMRHWFEAHGEGRWIKALAGLRTDRTRLEDRLKQVSDRLLGITNLNDDVMPTGSMLNTLQGLNRDTGVEVAEFEMGVHESPFVCANHQEPPRRFLTEFLDEERYGAVFEKFIERAVKHFSVGQAVASDNSTAWPARSTDEDEVVSVLS
jgi:pimeloyl-ACP methyl ester carboxylesterase